MIYYKVGRDSMGNLLIKPLAKRYHYLDLFLQAEADVEDFLGNCSPSIRKDLEQGYTVRVKLTDEYLNLMEDIYEQ